MNKPTISVVIPTHNRVEELQRALGSVYRQTLLPNELIVVDDGSESAITKDIFQDVPKSLETVLLRNDVPMGANHARNIGIKAANCDWIAFLDDDDAFYPNKIEVVSKAIKNNPDRDLFYHPAKINMVNEKLAYFTNPREYKPNDDIFRLLLIKNEIGGTSMAIVRRSKLFEVGGFDEQMPSMQDYELWLRLTKNGARVKKINQPLTKYSCITKKGSISKKYRV